MRKTKKTATEVRDPRLTGEVFMLGGGFRYEFITLKGCRCGAAREEEEDTRRKRAVECHDSDSQVRESTRSD
jgi:hypothetical protein